MSRCSKSRCSILLAATMGAAIVSLATAAMALPIGPISGTPSTLTETVRWCPSGTHQGYEGKYCWRGDAPACPPGFHRGYEGKYCWRDRS